MKKFEYMSRGDYLNAEDLNRYGEMGWDLVTAIFTTEDGYYYIFKREVI